MYSENFQKSLKAVEEARKEIKQGSLAHSFLERYLKKQH